MLQLLQRFTSPPVQTLTTLQPTPSTVRFTVSTRPVPRTVFALLGYYVSILFRVVFGALALFTLLVKWELRSGRQRVLHIILGTGGEAWITQWLQDLRWRYLIPVVSVILYLVLRRGYTGMLSIFPPASHGLLRERRLMAISSSYRRISSRSPEPRPPNVHYLLDILANSDDTFHTRNSYTGYLHT